MNWHLTDIQESLSNLNTDQQNGLSGSEASTRIIQYGHNELVERGHLFRAG